MVDPVPAPKPEALSSAARVLRRAKYYALINAFICGVAFASHALVKTSLYLHAQDSSSFWATMVAVYATGVLRVLAMIKWFEWIGTKKRKIFGDKRSQLTRQQRRAIYLRILWLIVPSECVSFYAASQLVSDSNEITEGVHGMLELATFIPKSLVFEIIFDLFHYAAHWLCHQIPWLYRHVHKRHHLHLHPCPLSTYEQDAVDLCLTNVLPFVLAARLGFPLSRWQLQLMLAYKTYVEVAGHCGLEVKGFSFPQFPWIHDMFTPLSLCVRDHDLHHTHPKYNFAKRFALWDKLFGTFKPGSSRQ
uniref:Fatty acid hydroxylase domain-containing protein n=1 Tax=Globisporangium ultimum (strain ATCC 200006 / CBS 805.95 / DAOM BR144) TaxID=431595 RepID=K3W7D5_GLOUD